MLSERLDSIAVELEANEAELEVMQKVRDDKWELYERLKAQEGDLTQQREDRLRDMEESVQAAKSEAAETSKQAREVSVCDRRSACILHLP